MKFLPLLVLLISPFVSALTLDDLQQRFTEQPVIRAHFDQTRTIKDLPQPLRSQGQMLIARDQGFHFNLITSVKTLTPKKGTL